MARISSIALCTLAGCEAYSLLTVPRVVSTPRTTPPNMQWGPSSNEFRYGPGEGEMGQSFGAVPIGANPAPAPEPVAPMQAAPEAVPPPEPVPPAQAEAAAMTPAAPAPVPADAPPPQQQQQQPVAAAPAAAEPQAVQRARLGRDPYWANVAIQEFRHGCGQLQQTSLDGVGGVMVPPLEGAPMPSQRGLLPAQQPNALRAAPQPKALGAAKPPPSVVANENDVSRVLPPGHAFRHGVGGYKPGQTTVGLN